MTIWGQRTLASRAGTRSASSDPFLQNKQKRETTSTAGDKCLFCKGKTSEGEKKNWCLLKLWKCSIVNDSDVESEHHRRTARSLFHNIGRLRKQCQSHHIPFYCTRFNGGLLVDNIVLMHREEKNRCSLRVQTVGLIWPSKDSVWTAVVVLVCGFYCSVVQVFVVSLFALGTQTLDLKLHFPPHSPFHQEHQLSATVRCANDALGFKVPCKAAWFLSLQWSEEHKQGYTLKKWGRCTSN